MLAQSSASARPVRKQVGPGRKHAASARHLLHCGRAVQTPRHAEATTVTMTCPWEFATKAEQGLRDGMEDSLQVYWDTTHQYLFVGCYDGHGGAAAAAWLESELHGFVASTVAQQGLSTDALACAFQVADKALLGHLEQLGGESQATAGSTATVALLTPQRVIVANVGDSQAFVMRKGSALSLTMPHRVYGSGKDVAAEVERVKATGGWVYDGRVCNILAVSRAFGDWEFKGKGLERLLPAGVERGFWPTSFARRQSFTSDPIIVNPATSDMPLTPEDEFLVISTDGLWDVMPPREVMQWARKELLRGRRPSQVAQSLTDLALKRKTSDNTSVVIVDLQGTEYWASKGKKSSAGLLSGLFGGK